jgi:hypothetical protein
MAQTKSIKSKEWLLLLFVAVSVVLVILVWWEGIQPGGEETPGFVRSTAVFEVDEDAYENWNAPEITATPTAYPTDQPQ